MSRVKYKESNDLFSNEIVRPILQHSVAIGENLKYLNYLVKQGDCFDVIYIDPPYNTGNNFSYNDKRTSEEWFNFIFQRLTLAHQILAKDGVIFISIDDSSLYELKIACDKIFCNSNFLGTFITKQAIRSNSKYINTIHEYVIAYAKDKKYLQEFKIKRLNNPEDAAMIKNISDKVKTHFTTYGKESAMRLLSKINEEYMKAKEITWLRNYSEIDENGDIFFPKDLSVPGIPADLFIEELNLHLPALKTRRWSSQQKFVSLHKKGLRQKTLRQER